MRSQRRTTVASLRAFLGIKDIELAEILECSAYTVHSLECPDRLALSDSMANRIRHETGVSIDWLLNGDPDAPIFTVDRRPYTREFYDRWRAKRRQPGPNKAVSQSAIWHYLDVRQLLRGAARTGDADLVSYKISKALHRIASDHKLEATNPVWDMGKSGRLADEIYELFENDLSSLERGLIVWNGISQKPSRFSKRRLKRSSGRRRRRG
jgi:transcriptional regulator with XRE-family HTH domain